MNVQISQRNPMISVFIPEADARLPYGVKTDRGQLRSQMWCQTGSAVYVCDDFKVRVSVRTATTLSGVNPPPPPSLK